MPVALRIGSYLFLFWSVDGRERPHIHVEHTGRSARTGTGACPYGGLGMGGLTTDDLIGIAQLPSPVLPLPSSVFPIFRLPYHFVTHRRLILQ